MLSESNYESVVPPLPRCVGKGGKQCPGREAEQELPLGNILLRPSVSHDEQNAAQIRPSFAGVIDDATPN